MDEDQLREMALAFLNGQGQYIKDESKSFYAAIKTYLFERPVSSIGLKHCPACESAICGICGKCHELDHEFLFVGRSCPIAVETSGTTPCVAWSWAYIFLRKAEKAGRE
jgi:hypothetical protein